MDIEEILTKASNGQLILAGGGYLILLICLGLWWIKDSKEKQAKRKIIAIKREAYAYMLKGWTLTNAHFWDAACISYNPKSRQVEDETGEFVHFWSDDYFPGVEWELIDDGGLCNE